MSSSLIYCFDTSAINRLLDDPEREPIVKTILSIGSFRISAYNLLEAAKTKNANRRSELIKLMWRLCDGKRLLNRPNTILLTYADAHASHESTVVVNADENLEGLWVALNQPKLIDQAAIDEILAWAATQEDNFSKIVTGDRDLFQSFFREAPQDRPRAAAAILRRYLEKEDECHSLIGDIYERRTKKSLSYSEYKVLVNEPAWALYFLAYAYAIYQRGIRDRNFSERRNAGAIDLGQAVYLTLCDRFVTDDRPQYRGLRLLNVLNNKRRTQVMQYDTFRSRLLISA